MVTINLMWFVYAYMIYAPFAIVFSLIWMWMDERTHTIQDWYYDEPSLVAWKKAPIRKTLFWIILPFAYMFYMLAAPIFFIRAWKHIGESITSFKKWRATKNRGKTQKECILGHSQRRKEESDE